MDTQSPLVLKTKLHRPPVNAEALCRKRLLAIMDRAQQFPLTLVSAPAGYGKSTLVSHWAESLDKPCAWLSLDPEDSDRQVFVRYVLAAIDTIHPGACPETHALNNAPNPVPVAILGGCLANELDSIDTTLVLVLDDYHRIDLQSDVHGLLRYLLEHMPRSLRLVLLTRSDPPLLIASLRAKGLVTEIRLRELMFTESECAEYLDRSSVVTVSKEALQNLQQQTEGWVVALRLTTMYLSYVDEPETFLRGMHGGIQYTREFLLVEVLNRLPPRLIACLMKTATLDRFCLQLCEAVCGNGSDTDDPDFDGRQFIETLLAGNLFVIPLDPQNRWFRYHHLFQEMLLEQLEIRTSKEEVAVLHRRASEWFETEGLITESIEHALAAGDAERAAEISERNRIAELDADRWYVVRKWLDMIPDACKQKRPGLQLAEAWIHYEQFQLAMIPPILEQAAQLLDSGSVDPALVGELHFFQAVFYYWEGKGPESSQKLQQARIGLPDPSGLIGGLLGLYDGITDCMNGRTERAIQTLNALLQETGSLAGIYNSRLVAGLYFVHQLSGDLVSAQAEGRRLQVVAEKSGIAYTAAWGRYMQGCSRLHRHDLVGAVDAFGHAVRQRYILHAWAALDAMAGLAISQQLTGEADAAAETLSLLEDFALHLDDPQCQMFAQSCRARVSLLQGNLAEAMQWTGSFNLPPAVQALFVWLEVPWITQARVLIADGTGESLEEALELLAAVRRLSENCRFTNQTIEVAVLQSLALEKQGHRVEAGETLQDALSLSEPGGWIRPFLEAEPRMIDMIGRLSAETHAGHLMEQILSVASETDAAQPPSKQASPDLLTNRELEILELLAQRLRYKEIAARLFISPQTVNSHLKNVYQKLDVGNRSQAVKRAAELGLFSLD